MKKQEFLDAITLKLQGLPKNEIEERLNFYSEIIDDKIEEGIDEEVAVSEIGSLDEISSQIIKEISIFKIAKEKIKLAKEKITIDRKLKPWEITLIAVGSPIWLSLLISAIAVIVCLYASLWAIVICFWAVFASLAVSGLCGIIASIVIGVSGNGPQALLIFGASLVCIGLAFFAYLVCIKVTKGTIVLTKKILLGLKKCFIKKEEA